MKSYLSDLTIILGDYVLEMGTNKLFQNKFIYLLHDTAINLSLKKFVAKNFDFPFEPF